MRNILVFIICLTLFFVLCIASDLTPFLRGPAPYPPDWRWEYLFVNTYNRIWVPTLCAVVIFISFVKIENENKAWLKKNKVFIVFTFSLLCFLFQLSVLHFNRAGIEVLLHRIINPGLNGYFSSAVEIESSITFLRNFNDTVLHLHQHAEGHPPFSVLFFYLINKLFLLTPFLNGLVSNLNPSTEDVRLIWNQLLPNEKLGALFSLTFIPILSSLVIVPLFAISNILYSLRSAIRVIFIYCFIPGVILFQPINDVFIGIFPLLSFLLFIKSYKENKVFYSVSSAVLFFTGLMFSLSILPLSILFIVYGLKFYKEIKLHLFFCVSLLVIFLLFLFFNFNFIQVFMTIMSGLPENRGYFPWVFYNLYDFIIFIGFGVTILYGAAIYKWLRSIHKRQKSDYLLVGTFVMLLMLNLSGSVRGEVGRIWIPLMPFLLLPAVDFVSRKDGLFFSTKDMVFLALAQVLLVLAINEYWVTLW